MTSLDDRDGAALVAEGICVRYGQKVALDAVSFTVARGETVALIGRNGAGKTSAVRCLLGQQRPDRGQVHIGGRNVWRDRAAAMERVGVVPEESDLPPEMTGEGLIGLCGSFYRRFDAAAVRTRLVRMAVPLDVASGRLSKGQKAQLSLALALGHGPDLLVLDDPTLGLDAIARREFFGEVIDELADRGMSILITSHDLAGIERIASRVVILSGGKVVVDQEIEALKAGFRRLPGGSASLEDIFAGVMEQHAGVVTPLGARSGMEAAS